MSMHADIILLTIFGVIFFVWAVWAEITKGELWNRNVELEQENGYLKDQLRKLETPIE